METFDLGFKGFFVSLLFFLGTCGLSEPVTLNQPNLVTPKDENAENYESVTTKLTLVLLENDRIYAYESNELDKGKIYDKQSISTVIKRSKEKFASNDFVVVIKTGPKASYDLTVDMLDQMLIQKIKKYAVVDLQEKELKSIR